jgi:hypothetical protein
MSRLFPFLLFLFCIRSYATHLTTEEINNIEKECLQSTPSCLALLEVALNDSQPSSTQWYRFKKLRLIALFDLQKTTQLTQEINYWMSLSESELSQLPPNFAVYIYIYNAKLANASGTDEKHQQEATLYLDKAVKLLSDINETAPSPFRLIEIANLQISMKRYEQAKKTLHDLDDKFSHVEHPVFKQELFANLGHIAYLTNEKDLHIEYRKESLLWTLKTTNTQQKSVAHLNLAVAYQKNAQYKNAELHYREVKKLSTIAQDHQVYESSTLRLIEVVHLQGNIAEANRLYNQIPKSSHPDIASGKNKNLFEKVTLALE